MAYHGIVRGPSGQTYQCEHNHRTETAAITCANSSATRRMASIAWRRAEIRAAQAAAVQKRREEQRAAARAQRVAAQEAAAARQAAARVAAEQAKAAKRAAKLAAMPPRRAWKRMTREERLLRTAETELAVYGEIISPEAKAAHDAEAAKRPAADALSQRSAASMNLLSPQTPSPDRPARDLAADTSRPPVESLSANGRNANGKLPLRNDLMVAAVQEQSHAGRDVAMPPPRRPAGKDDLHPSRSPTGVKYRHIGIEITLLEVRSSGTVPVKQHRARRRDDLLAGEGAEFVVVRTQVLNDGMKSICLTCARPIQTYVFDDRGRRFDSVGGLYQIAGNPDCSDYLQPGLTSEMTWAYRVPAHTNVVSFEFEDISDHNRVRTIRPARISLAGAR